MAQRLKDSILIEDVMNLLLVASKHPVHEVDRIFLCLIFFNVWMFMLLGMFVAQSTFCRKDRENTLLFMEE